MRAPTTILYSANWSHPSPLVRDGGIDEQFNAPPSWTDDQIDTRFRELGMDESGSAVKVLTSRGYSFTWSWRRGEAGA